MEEVVPFKYVVNAAIAEAVFPFRRQRTPKLKDSMALRYYMWGVG